MPKQRFSLYTLAAISAIALLLVVIFGAFAGGLILAPYINQEAQAAPALPVAPLAQVVPQLPDDQTDILAAYEQAMIELYQKTVPSVVYIRVTQKIDHPVINRFDFGQSPDNPEDFFSQGQGSGFVWDKEGHIVTNYHVVANATTVEVTFADGTTAKAEVLGSDPNADLAVIKVDVPASELVPASLGDSSTLKVGQVAIALGNPFGQQFTMTKGIVSAVGRTIRSGNTAFSIPAAIQTDAPINPGNSGGPLFDRQGQVIGINTQIISRSGGNSGIGFAVPVNTAKLVAPTLIKGQTYQYSWLGISGSNLIPEISDVMKLPAETRGALVIEVVKDGPADKAGLKGSDKALTVDGQDYQIGGDLITAINGRPVQGMDDLITYLVENTRPGDEVKLDVIRSDGSQETVTVSLGVRPGMDEMNQGQDN